MTYSEFDKLITGKIPKIPRDKIQHFTMSLFLTLCFGFNIAITIGIAKELYDKESGKGTPCFYDLTADLLGCWTGTIINTLLNTYY